VRIILFFILAFCGVAIAAAQNAAPQNNGQSDHDMQSMPGMNPAPQNGMPGMPGMQAGMESHSLLELVQQHAVSGTDAEPNSTPVEMLMTAKKNWTFMFHGEAFLADIQQSGPRGADKLFSVNWIMPMAQRRVGKGTLTLRSMLSFEPATVSQRRYPELFQQGETAFGYVRLQTWRKHFAFVLCGAHGRSGDGATGLSAPGFCVRKPGCRSRPPSSGFHAYRGRCGYGGIDASGIQAGSFRLSRSRIG